MRNHRLEHGIRTFLQVLRVPGAEGVNVEADDGRVVIRGQLPSQRAKAWCYECCRHVTGVTQVVDATEVRAACA
jgi:osmotically-inducible protein OsmY